MTRSDADLIDGMKHIAYEVWMAAECGHVVRTAPNTGPSVEMNAAIEAGLIHARVITEFFKARVRPHPDDMLPTHFAPAWVPAPAAGFTLLEDNNLLLHKHVAHLSWVRSHDTSQRVDSMALMDAAARIGLAWHEHVRAKNPNIGNDTEVCATMLHARNALNDRPMTAIAGPSGSTSAPPPHPRGATGPLG